MNLTSTTEQKLKIAIYYNKVINYLEGAGVYKINSDPRDVTSPHNFNFSIECYNKLAAKCPQLKLDQLFVEEIISKLKSNDCDLYDVYYIFNCIVAQLRLEKNNLSSFIIENSKLDEMFQILRKKVSALRDDLKRCKDKKGEYYTDGMYGYMQSESNRVYNEVGRRIL
jgi:hypothetical protein